MSFPIFASSSEKLRGLAAAFACAALAVVSAPNASGAEPPAAAEEALPPLPAPPKTALPRPEPKRLEELDARLEALLAEDAAARDAAARELLESGPDLVPAVAFRLEGLAERADKEAMKRTFGAIRLAARGEERDAEEGAEGSATGDYLAMVLARPERSKPAYRDVVAAIAMSRMLTHAGNVEAVRTLIDVYVRFGEFLRIHVQRELATLGNRAVPALIEARRHPAEKINRWAKRQLDALGRAVPSEAVQIPDHQVLADVLRAYGKTRDPDAARIVVSFANSERAIVREAARQAIAAMGDVAMWQIRDAYEATVGKRPERDWSWDRAARELFAAFDRTRTASAGRAFEAGRVARARGDLEAMRKAFDEVLAQDPRFERGDELAKGYREYAERVLDDRPKEALDALVRAERLSRAPEDKRRLESLTLTLRAADGVARGVADLALLKRALELDAGNARARALLEQLERGEPDRSSERARQLAAGTIGLGALIAVAVLLLRRRGEAPKASPPEPKPDQAA